MHKPLAARRIGSEYLWLTFVEHAVIHHKRCAFLFDQQSGLRCSVNIGIKPVTSISIVLVPCSLLASMDILTSFVLFVTAILHGVIWSRVHHEMHNPSNAFFSKLLAYRFLKEWHYLHHRHPGTNFNALCPMWDWIFRSVASPTDEDLSEIKSGLWRLSYQPESAARFFGCRSNGG
jgi:hypothetical protein